MAYFYLFTVTFYVMNYRYLVKKNILIISLFNKTIINICLNFVYFDEYLC